MTDHFEQETVDTADADTSESWFSDPDVLSTEARKHFRRASPIGQIPGLEIRACISRGGQGTVYAGRDLATNAFVAVKVLSDGNFSSDTARRRFEREIEIARTLQHEHIVPILQHGATARGLPFLVMPQINGVPLDEWAKTKRGANDLHTIIAFFCDLCRAIQFAHQRGIIHRDLKPSNVLVDESNAPRVLDFGLAKAEPVVAAMPSTNMSMTQEGQFVGSLPWTSPEQLECGARLVDVRTDIYALGVMLYEALTGQFPYTVQGALPAVVHGVMNTAPPPPSSHVPGLSRDLDAIVLKALAKSPDERYQSADDFARDLQRYRAGEPNLARREESRRTLQRNVRRYQAITLVSAILLAFSTFMYFRASADRDRAKTEAHKAQASAEFLQDLFRGVDARDRGVDVTVAELLDQAATTIPVQFADQPEVQATLEFMLGRAYLHMGILDKARPHLQRSYDSRRALFGDDHIDTARSAWYVYGDASFSATERRIQYERIADIFRRELGKNHADTLSVEHTLLNAAPPDMSDAEYITAYADRFDRVAKIRSEDDREYDRAHWQHCHANFLVGSLREAERLHREYWHKLAEHPDPDYEFRIGAAYAIGFIDLLHERFDEAAPMIKYSYAAKERALGAHHWSVYHHRLLRIELLLAMKNVDDAVADLRALDQVIRNSSTPGYVSYNNYIATAAAVSAAQGQFDDALRMLESKADTAEVDSFREQLELKRLKLGLVTTLLSAGEFERARPRAAALIAEGPDRQIADYQFARLQLEYAECLIELERFDEARRHLGDAAESLRSIYEEPHSLLQRVDAAFAVLDALDEGLASDHIAD